jgi:hypothetical protein
MGDILDSHLCYYLYNPKLEPLILERPILRTAKPRRATKLTPGIEAAVALLISNHVIVPLHIVLSS